MHISSDLLALSPTPEWQGRAKYHITRSQMTLWNSPVGKRGLDYLMKERGLTEATIRYFRLGYNPADTFDPPELWGLDGKKVYIPGPGIVIPHISGVDSDNQPVVWGLKVRRFAPPGNWDGKRQNWRYTAPRGTVTCLLGVNGWGMGETLPPGLLNGTAYKRPLLFCSGEFDMMTAWQEAGPGHEKGAIVDVCSLAGEGKNVPAAWFDYCMAYKLILIGYDADGPGAKYGSKLVESMAQAKPLKWPIKDAKDINELVATQKGNLKALLGRSIIDNLLVETPPAAKPSSLDLVKLTKFQKFPVKIFWPHGYPETGDECFIGGEIPFDCFLSIYHTPERLAQGLNLLFLFRLAQSYGGEFVEEIT